MGNHYRTLTSTILFILKLTSIACRNETGESRLFNDIIWTNNRYERPVYNKSNSIDVNLDFYLRSVRQFIESEQHLVCSGWFVISWMDEFLSWDPSFYNGTSHIRPPVGNVWTPGLVASSSFQQVDIIGGDYAALIVFPTGAVQWMPGDVFHIPCEVDIHHYPFDGIVCHLEIVPWSYMKSEVALKPVETSVLTSGFKTSGQWELVSTTITEDVITPGNRTVSRVGIELKLRRHPVNFVFSFILPVFILSLLGTFVFLIPSDSGEKISFAITIPLSYGVYMGFLTNLVPQTSNGISIFVIFLGVTLLFSAIFVILSIFSVRMIHHNDTNKPLPKVLRKITLWSERFGNCRKDRISDDSKYDSQSESSEIDHVTWLRASRAFDRIFFWSFIVPLLVCAVSMIFIVT